MGMSRRDEDVLARNPSFVAGPLTDFAGNETGHADQIAKDQSGAVVALAQDNRFRLQRIMNARAQPLVEIATHPPANRRCNIGCGEASLKRCGIDGWPWEHKKEQQCELDASHVQ